MRNISWTFKFCSLYHSLLKLTLKKHQRFGIWAFVKGNRWQSVSNYAKNLFVTRGRHDLGRILVWFTRKKLTWWVSKCPNYHEDVIKWKHLMFALICAWINDWVKNREAGDLRRYLTHCDVIVMGIRMLMTRLHWRWATHMCFVVHFRRYIRYKISSKSSTDANLHL